MTSFLLGPGLIPGVINIRPAAGGSAVKIFGAAEIERKPWL